MKTKLLMAVGLVLVVAGVWVAAQEAAPRGDAARALYDQAKAALKGGQYDEARAAADKMLELDKDDLRAKYLKQAADYYQNGAAAQSATPPTVVAASTATSAVGVATASSGEPSTVAAAQSGPMTKEEVDKLYKTFEKNMTEFRGTIQSVLVNRCGNDNCHGNVGHAGRFYLINKNLGDRTTIAENFRAMDRYIDHTTFENSRLLMMAVAKSDVHPTDKAPILTNENDTTYKSLKAFILKLPNAADLMWGTSH